MEEQVHMLKHEHLKTDGAYGEMVVSVCPMKAPEGHSKRFTHSSFGAFIQRTETFSSITFGLVSVMSLKCLLKMYLVNIGVVLIYLYMSLAVMLLGRYLIPTIVFT